MLNDAPFGNEAAIVLPMSAYELADRLTRKGMCRASRRELLQKYG